MEDQYQPNKAKCAVSVDINSINLLLDYYHWQGTGIVATITTD